MTCTVLQGKVNLFPYRKYHTVNAHYTTKVIDNVIGNLQHADVIDD